jgi:hypothetical protein
MGECLKNRKSKLWKNGEVAKLLRLLLNPNTFIDNWSINT